MRALLERDATGLGLEADMLFADVADHWQVEDRAAEIGTPFAQLKQQLAAIPANVEYFCVPREIIKRTMQARAS